jgi:capsular polysaccharide transport system permease protein
MANQSTARASDAAQAAPDAEKPEAATNEAQSRKASPPAKPAAAKPAAAKPAPAKPKPDAEPAGTGAAAKRPAAKAAPAAKRGQVVDHPALGTLTVKRAKPRLRHYATLLSFVLAVLLPSAVTVGYLYTRAADQYASSVAFSVRSGESVIPSGLLGVFAQQVSSAGADAEIVYEFVRSQKMIEAALATLPLEAIYNRPERDFVFRLGEEQPVEDIVAYWNRMTDISFDPGTGIVRFEARAFTAEDAQRIADFVLAESTRIVNDLSEQAREDAIRVASIAVTEAEERLREARRAMREFRNLEQEIDPTENAAAKLGLVAALEQALAETRVELDTELQLVGERSPKVSQLRQRIASIEKQITDERARLGAGATGDAEAERRFANVVSAYEERQVDLEFAQNAYTSALAAFEQAQIEARRQSRFLAPHIEPTLSVAPQYPQRALLSLAVFGLLTAAWAVVLLIVYNIRERH